MFKFRNNAKVSNKGIKHIEIFIRHFNEMCHWNNGFIAWMPMYISICAPW